MSSNAIVCNVVKSAHSSITTCNLCREIKEVSETAVTHVRIVHGHATVILYVKYIHKCPVGFYVIHSTLYWESADSRNRKTKDSSLQRNYMSMKNNEHIELSVHVLTCVEDTNLLSGIAGSRTDREVDTGIQVPEGITPDSVVTVVVGLRNVI